LYHIITYIYRKLVRKKVKFYDSEVGLIHYLQHRKEFLYMYSMKNKYFYLKNKKNILTKIFKIFTRRLRI